MDIFEKCRKRGMVHVNCLSLCGQHKKGIPLQDN